MANKGASSKPNMNFRIINQYIKDYELGNLRISPGGNFQDFLNRLIGFYESGPQNIKNLNLLLRSYRLSNLHISPGGNFQDFLNKLISYYETESVYTSPSRKLFKETIKGLDRAEMQHYTYFNSRGQSGESVLRIIINTVEGDWSQLSPALLKYAKATQPSMQSASRSDSFNYYKSQLTRLNPVAPYSAKYEIRDGTGNKTNYISMNKYSVPVLIAFLKGRRARDSKQRHYYLSQLARLQKSEYAMAIRFHDGDGVHTNWMNLNKESAPVFVSWLEAGGYKPKRRQSASRSLSPPEKHQLRIAKDTLKMSDMGASVMGGMTKAEAREVLKRHGIRNTYEQQSASQSHSQVVNEVYNHFIVASLWATLDNDVKGEAHLDAKYGISDVSQESEMAIKNNITLFLTENNAILKKHGIPGENIGHDLFLTSQHHGAGFWDRGYGKDGNILTKSSQKYFGEGNPYAGDDGKLYYSVKNVKGSTTKAMTCPTCKGALRNDAGMWYCPQCSGYKQSATRKMTKGQKFNYDVQQFVESLNPKKGDFMYLWEIQTIYGPLRITVHDSVPRQKFFSIFTQFEFPQRATKGGLDNNQFSGKWNFHSSDAESLLGHFKSNVNAILSKKGTRKQSASRTAIENITVPFDVAGAEVIAKRLIEALDVPHVWAYVSTLGDVNRPSVMLTITFDKKKDWPNEYIENSRYTKFHIYNDGVIAQFVKQYTIPKKFRKARFKNLPELVMKLNKYIAQVKAELPVLQSANRSKQSNSMTKVKKVTGNPYKNIYSDKIHFIFNAKTMEVVPTYVRNFRGSSWADVFVGAYTQKARNTEANTVLSELTRWYYPEHRGISTFTSLSFHRGVHDQISTYGVEPQMRQYSYYRGIGMVKSPFSFKTAMQGKDFGKNITQFQLYEWKFIVNNWIPETPRKWRVSETWSDIYDKKRVSYVSKIFSESKKEQALELFYKRVDAFRKSTGLKGLPSDTNIKMMRGKSKKSSNQRSTNIGNWEMVWDKPTSVQYEWRGRLMTREIHITEFKPDGWCVIMKNKGEDLYNLGTHIGSREEALRVATSYMKQNS